MKFLSVPGWESYGEIAHGFGTRGVSGDRVGRKHWWGQAVHQEGGQEFPLVSLRQVHGHRVVVFGGHPDRIAEIWAEEGDALITRARGFALGVFTADCLPIFLYDPDQKAIGIVHAGWRGTARGVSRKAVRKMKEIFGSKEDQILAALGPCIGPCCLEVDAPVREIFSENHLPWDPFSYPRGKGKWSLDLCRANIYLLEGEGVRRKNIQRLSFCTCCRGDLFYSYRRGDRGRGRQLNFIALKKIRIFPEDP